jgi:hypothetical protein
MKKKIQQMRALKIALDKNNWQNQKLLAKWHKLGAKISMELAVNLTLFADLDMVIVCAWQGKKSFVGFNVESAVPNGSGLQLNCQLDVAECSHPRPRGIKLPGLADACVGN